MADYLLSPLVDAIVGKLEESIKEIKLKRLNYGGLKDVAYETDDVVEEFATQVLRLKLEGGDQFRKRKHQDKEKIVKLLLDESASSSSSSSSSKDISVIPIVSIGGLGKTTLAQFIYNDESVGDHFPVRGWVRVSEDFDMRGLTKAIMESVTKKPCDLKEIDPLQYKCATYAFFLLYVVVVSVSFILKIIHSENDMSHTVAPKEVRCLHSHPSQRVQHSTENHMELWMGSSDVPPTLIAIGKDIAKKCKGLSLAMEALRGLLPTNTDENKWNNILESDMWEISGMEKNIIPILKARYDNLPACMKQYFVCCSLYPKDYKFEKDTLIQLWIAEGFIQPEGRK
ncbi:disease resistance protein RGA2-like [Tasmannia lanceolata]|uniref:disease resistance protein RGA2-like n=1 Tax=Tasmannia lanceolata TaxID=3420 RepID=UPI0040629934